MPSNKEQTTSRKKDHIDICLTDEGAFKNKSSGFERYDFEHYAATEVVTR